MYVVPESVSPRGLVHDADAAPAYQFFDVVDEEAVGGDQHVVGLENGAELSGLFEVEQDFALAGGS